MILLLLGCATDPVFSLEGDPIAGGTTWAQECGICHGQEGEGTPRGVALEDIFESRTELDVLNTVRFGVDTMPAYETALTTQDQADLLAWMRANL